MKKFIEPFIVAMSMAICLLIGFVGGAQYVKHTPYYKSISYRTKLNKAYKQYMRGTEQLLDELDSAYCWVDGYDNYDYYAGKHKVDSLLKAN